MAGVAVLGPGGIGALLAGLIQRAGADVTCVAREATAAAIRERGIEVRSPCFGDFGERPRSVERLDADASLLIVATKAAGLERALERVPPERVRGALVVPMLNGFEHVALLRERFGARVAAATIGLVQAELVAPGVVEHRSPQPPQVLISAEGVEDATAVTGAAALLERAGCEVRQLERAADVLWGKLVRLNAIALATAASGRQLGPLRDDPERRAQIDACIREAAAVARAEGAEADADATIAQVDGLPATLGTSLQRDVERGDPGELDAIAGAIARAGRRHGIACPAIEALICEVETRLEARR